MLELFAVLLLLIPIFAIFAIVVGAVARSKNRSFTGWFLLSFLITPLFAILALIALPPLDPIETRAVLPMRLALWLVIAGGVGWVVWYASDRPRIAASSPPATTTRLHPASW